MGNQVVVVVPFSKFDTLRKTDVVDIIKSDMNNPDFTVVKSLRLGIYPQQLFQNDNTSKDLLCSSYHHSGDNTSLYIDSENLTDFPNFKHNIHESDDKVSTFLKNYRFDYKQLSAVLSKRAIKPLPEAREKYLVFGLLTDYLHSLTNQDFAALLDYAESMVSMEDNESAHVDSNEHSKFGYYETGNFLPIAVLHSHQFCVVSMNRNVFEVTAMRKYANIKPEMIEIADIDNLGHFKSKGAVNMSFKRHVIESLGFNVKLK